MYFIRFQFYINVTVCVCKSYASTVHVIEWATIVEAFIPVPLSRGLVSPPALMQPAGVQSSTDLWRLGYELQGCGLVMAAGVTHPITLK